MADTTRRVVLQLLAQNKATAQLAGFRRDIRSTTTAVKRMAGSLLGMAGIGVGLYGVVRGIRSIVDATIQQEEAEISLAAALGDATLMRDRALRSLKAHAAGLQRLTIYGDEAILSQMAYAKNLGVTADKLNEAATAAIGLAAKYRIELSAAMMLIGRASQGQTQMLTRYGIVLDQTLSDQEKFNAILKIGAESFHLAEAAAETSAGKFKQLQNSMGDLKEKIGVPLVAVLADTADTLTRIISLIPDMGDAVAKGMAAIKVPMSDLVRTLAALERAGLIKGEGVFTPLKMGAGGKLIPDESTRGAPSPAGPKAFRTQFSGQIPSAAQRRMSSVAWAEERRQQEKYDAYYRQMTMKRLDRYEAAHKQETRAAKAATVDVAAAYARMYERFRQLYARLAQRAAERDAALREVNGDHVDLARRAQAAAESLRVWEHETFAAYAEAAQTALQHSGHTVLDTSTDEAGAVQLELPPGNWWLVARWADPHNPFQEYYWNVPLTSSGWLPLWVPLMDGNSRRRWRH